MVDGNGSNHGSIKRIPTHHDIFGASDSDEESDRLKNESLPTKRRGKFSQKEDNEIKMRVNEFMQLQHLKIEDIFPALGDSKRTRRYPIWRDLAVTMPGRDRKV